MKIYVASSWRNVYQQDVVNLLRDRGHEVYDFKKPEMGSDGFNWSECIAGYQRGDVWSADALNIIYKNPIAINGFKRDMTALGECDACVLVLPAGRSAHIEAGFAVGANKKVIVYMPENEEPDLMYMMVYKVTGLLQEVAMELEETVQL